MANARKSGRFFADVPRMSHSITGDILLDAGTNELEVLVFRMASGNFGVNVAKVREVIKPVPTVPAPGQHKSVLGMINIRGSVLPVVDLAKHLSLRANDEDCKPQATDRIVITEFNGLRAGFLVAGVEQIYRMGWDRVKPAPDTSFAGTPPTLNGVSTITGIIEQNERLVMMLDFESIADAILSERRLKVETVPNDLNVDRAAQRVIIAEDSPFMRGLIRDVFLRSGYTKIEVCSDGAAAWDAINQGPAPTCVVSDIEMPRIDGLHLTKRIKNTPSLAATKVVLFSSLISDDNRKKGQQVGADAQVSKPELSAMVQLVDRAVAGLAIELPAAKKAA
jgi:two-component system chemotaxis response regulator CheV